MKDELVKSVRGDGGYYEKFKKNEALKKDIAALGASSYPRANERVGIPPRRTDGSFGSALINRRNNFRITHACTLRQFEGNITNESTPGILTNRFVITKLMNESFLLSF